MPPADPLIHWREFYALIGGAAATLIGLMFVTASIGAGVISGERRIGIPLFLSPTVVHFGAVLVVCLIGTIPTESRVSLAILLLLGGLCGLGYAFSVLRRMRKHGVTVKIDLIDRLWYARLPILGYLLVCAAALGFATRREGSPNLLALAVILLLLAGIRNAWDMTVWITERRQG
ncbi:MAG TPA: hypothetical protein VKS22_12380 [Candidatus Binataceae bacterium]|nr:hypothetical protein [Candidatus Binataceae bacterium]